MRRDKDDVPVGGLVDQLGPYGVLAAEVARPFVTVAELEPAGTRLGGWGGARLRNLGCDLGRRCLWRGLGLGGEFRLGRGLGLGCRLGLGVDSVPGVGVASVSGVVSVSGVRSGVGVALVSGVAAFSDVAGAREVHTGSGVLMARSKRDFL